jgi:hypothetical protein
LHADAAREWGFALTFLALISVFFLALRVLGRAFIAWEFELLVIYVPTLVCLVFYVLKRRAALPSEDRGHALHEPTR